MTWKYFASLYTLLGAVPEQKIDESKAKEMTEQTLPINAHDSIHNVHQGAWGSGGKQ